MSTTRYYEIIPFARLILGDLAKDKYTDDIILTALQVTTGFLQLMGYDKGHTSDYNEITPALIEKEKALWGKAAAVLIRNPEVLRAASEGISIRTEEVAYDTSRNASVLQQLNAEDLRSLSLMIYALSDGLIARRPDFGVQVGKGSLLYGMDVIDD